MDREKVKYDIERCICHVPDACRDCSHYKDNELDCIEKLLADALELLKEQKAIEPLFVENPYTHLPVSYCPKCREPISKFITGNPYKETKYCHYCGQEVRWE